MLTLGASCRSVDGPAPHPPRPNILVVLSDDHATSAIGAYGAPYRATPTIDRLAAEGVLFERAFVENAICAPSRAALLTGRAGRANGVQTNADRLDGSQPTFPALLQTVGYHTALFGKWHLKSDPTGFDTWEILPGQGQYYAPEFRTSSGTRTYPGYVSDVTTDLTLQFLEHEWDRTRPFLVLCQHKAPHRSWMPPIEHLDDFANAALPEPATLFDDGRGRSSAARTQEMTIARHLHLAYDLQVPLAEGEAASGPDRAASDNLARLTPAERRVWDAAYGPRNAAFRAAELEGDALTRWKFQRYLKNYLRTASSVDDSLERLLAWLESEGQAENTLVVYLSDQGFFLGEHGWYDKRFAYEPSARFPLVVRWPAATPMTSGGRRDMHLVQNFDLAPTLLDAAGVQVPEVFEGRSLVPLILGERPGAWRDAVFYEYLETGEHAVQPHRAVRTERYKLIWFFDTDEWELYDLERDPLEVANLANEPGHQLVLQDLRARLGTHFD